MSSSGLQSGSEGKREILASLVFPGQSFPFQFDAVFSLQVIGLRGLVFRDRLQATNRVDAAVLSVPRAHVRLHTPLVCFSQPLEGQRRVRCAMLANHMNTNTIEVKTATLRDFDDEETQVEGGAWLSPEAWLRTNLELERLRERRAESTVVTLSIVAGGLLAGLAAGYWLASRDD
jgi:hypothetical protein